MEWQNITATEFLLVAVAVWLAFLSYFLIKTLSHYRKITQGAKNQNLGQILENIVARQNSQTKNTTQLAEEIAKIQKSQRGNFQKSAFLRFNPFEDTGGDQSFAVALLDGNNNGIVISSLHSRVGTRIYAKSVTNGKSQAHQFSKEEKEVVEKACLVTRPAAQK